MWVNTDEGLDTMTYSARDIANGKATVARTPVGTQKKCAEINKAFPAVVVVWGDGPTGDHAKGLALDFMVAGDRKLGDAIAAYAWTHRVRLGVEYIIWYQRIISTVKSPGVWRAMETRKGGTTANHKDHVHISFKTSTYIPLPVSKPKPPTVDLELRRGDTGERVKVLQRGLNKNFPMYSKLKIDGSFGPAVETVIEKFQKYSGLRVDGVVGPVTRTLLINRYGIKL